MSKKYNNLIDYGCVYFMINTTNNKIYVGSTVDYEKRVKRHISEIKRGLHHNLLIQKDSNSNPDIFDFIIIDEIFNAVRNELYELEDYYITKLNKDNLYNIGDAIFGDVISKHPQKDYIISKRSNNIIERNKNLTYDEIIEKYSKPGELNGRYIDGRTMIKHYCECGNEKSYLSNRCKKCNDSDRVGSKNNFYGKKHTPETLEKIRQSNIGRKSPNRIRIEIDGIEYDSYADAKKELGIPVVTIRHRVLSPNEKFINWKLL